MSLCGFLPPWQNYGTVAKGGRIAMDDPSITPVLTGSNFSPDMPAMALGFKDGTSWPVRAGKSR